MNISKANVFFTSLLIILITFVCISKWSYFQLAEYIPFANFITGYLMLFTCFYFKHKSVIPNKKHYLIVNVFLIWWIFEIIRGYLYFCPNYYVKRQLLEGVIRTSMPLFCYLAVYPFFLGRILHYWFKWCLPLFLLFYAWVMIPDGYHFYLAPIFIIGGMLPFIPRKYRYVIGGLLLIMSFVDLGARSQVIKSIIAIAMSLVLMLKKFISIKALKIVHWLIYGMSLLLLFLGLSGKFNIFTDISERATMTSVDSHGNVMEIGDDTRTALYYEVFESAVDNNYVILGRTPARGHDSRMWGDTNAFKTRTGLNERFFDEMCHTNIFTQFGLIGIIIYSLIYLASSYLALYKSNSFVMKLLGVLVAFHWLYGWIEDFNDMSIGNISLWMIIGMGLSQRFREMEDVDFKKWIMVIFKR